MLTPLLVALSIGGALPLSRGLLLAAVWETPEISGLVLIGVCAWASRQKRRLRTGGAVAAFHRTVAAELRSGRSLRLAVAGASRHVADLNLKDVARLAESGRPLEEIAAKLNRDSRLSPAATAIKVAAITGGSVALIFDALTAEAVDEEALRMEQRALTVQARLSVAIVGGFPFFVLAGQLLSGELSKSITRGPVGAALVTIGVSLLTTGLLVVFWLIRRARR
jgi:Flp pilus assembly protein TadB